MPVPPDARTHRFELRTRYEAAEIAHRVALLTASPTRIELPLLELLLNAIEHGNLELGFERKRELVTLGKLDEEVRRIQATSPFDRRVVRLDVWEWDQGARFVVTDEGPGFPWKCDGEPGLGHARPSGRGLGLARAMTERLAFNDRGNVVTVDLRW